MLENILKLFDPTNVCFLQVTCKPSFYCMPVSVLYNVFGI